MDGLSKKKRSGVVAVSPLPVGVGETRIENNCYVRQYVDHYADPVSDPRLFVQTEKHERRSKLIISLIGRRVSFPRILYELLMDATEQNFEDIISWKFHGRAFQIFDKARFERYILPR